MIDLDDGDDRADAVTLDELRALGAVSPPRTAFAQSLKETLMHAPTISNVIAPSGDRPIRDHAGMAKPVVRTLRHPASSAFAMTALLAIIVIGGYLALIAPRGGGGGRPTVPAVGMVATPSASPSAESSAGRTCAANDPFVCAQLLRPIGNMTIQPQFLDMDAAASNVRRVQLQGWAVAPGATIDGVIGNTVAHGVVVDVVLSGSYVATFTVPVVVSPGSVTNDPIQYLDAGVPVELGRGDAVAYRLGGMTQINNPLSTQRLEFKRAVVYDGDISAFSATTDGVTTRVEGDATLPEALGTFSYGARVELWFLDVLPTPFPPARWTSWTIIGPVDPQRGPEGTEGFVLVVGPSGA